MIDEILFTLHLISPHRDPRPIVQRLDAARRIYRRVARAPLRYHAMVERVVDELLEGLESTEETSDKRS